MSKIVEQLKEEKLNARKQRDNRKVGIISTFLAEVLPSGSEDQITDEQVIKALEKRKKTMKDNKQKYGCAYTQEQLVYMECEADILFRYIPQKASEKQIKEQVRSIMDQYGDLNIGFIMPILRERLGDSFDGKTASQVVKKMVS